MEITIKTVKNKRKKQFFFKVICGKKSTSDLCYAEMIGLVSALTMPEERPVQLLLTEQQHQEIIKYLEQ
jgi:hypothetical protein